MTFPYPSRLPLTTGEFWLKPVWVSSFSSSESNHDEVCHALMAGSALGRPGAPQTFLFIAGEKAGFGAQSSKKHAPNYPLTSRAWCLLLWALRAGKFLTAAPSQSWWDTVSFDLPLSSTLGPQRNYKAGRV